MPVRPTALEDLRVGSVDPNHVGNGEEVENPGDSGENGGSDCVFVFGGQ